MKDDNLGSVLLDTWHELQKPQLLTQLGIAAGCLAVGWVIAYFTKRALVRRAKDYVHLNPERNAKLLRTRFEGLDRVLMPLFAWVFGTIAERVMTGYRQPHHILRIFSILAIAYVGINIGLYTLRRVFKPSPGMLLVERWFGILGWLLVVLHVTGFLPDVIAAFSGPEATFAFGKNVTISVWQVLSAAFWIFVTMVAALGIGTILETRLMRAESIDGSIRIVLARLANAVLIVVAILIAMRLVDIDITVLSVFGGALGVGLGLGLQKIASNYVSGFIILLDRSLRIGDVITVDKYNGSVTQIRTRCTVVRAPNGVEALVPNDLLLNQAVQNFSYGDKNGSVATRIRVAYDTDIDHAMDLMLRAARAQPRVIEAPAATVFLKDFGQDGIELEATCWVRDPEAGTDGLRSDVNRAIWRAFKDAGIKVPLPQREVRVSSMVEGADQAPLASLPADQSERNGPAPV
ncbi:MAG: mechanosensitive ion channel domain-containing protein [Burkholderiaceae bacterium]